jgi:hypothetical protein
MKPSLIKWKWLSEKVILELQKLHTDIETQFVSFKRIIPYNRIMKCILYNNYPSYLIQEHEFPSMTTLTAFIMFTNHRSYQHDML